MPRPSDKPVKRAIAPASLCSHCKTREATRSFTTDPKSLCDRCFAEGLERRIRTKLRPLDLASRQKIIYADDKSAAAAVTRFILHKILGKTRVRIEAAESADAAQDPASAGMIFLPLSIEEVTAQGMRAFLEPNTPLLLPLSAVANASMPELEAFCALKGLPYTHRATLTNELLETIQAHYPQTYFSTLASLEQLSRNARDKQPTHARAKNEQL